MPRPRVRAADERAARRAAALLPPGAPGAQAGMQNRNHRLMMIGCVMMRTSIRRGRHQGAPAGPLPACMSSPSAAAHAPPLAAGAGGGGSVVSGTRAPTACYLDISSLFSSICISGRLQTQTVTVPQAHPPRDEAARRPAAPGGHHPRCCDKLIQLAGGLCGQEQRGTGADARAGDHARILQDRKCRLHARYG